MMKMIRQVLSVATTLPQKTFSVMLLIINYCFPLMGSLGNDVETKDVTMK